MRRAVVSNRSSEVRTWRARSSAMTQDVVSSGKVGVVYVVVQGCQAVAFGGYTEPPLGDQSMPQKERHPGQVPACSGCHARSSAGFGGGT